MHLNIQDAKVGLTIPICEFRDLLFAVCLCRQLGSSLEVHIMRAGGGKRDLLKRRLVVQLLDVAILEL
jgi:hypothetical protein